MGNGTGIAIYPSSEGARGLVCSESERIFEPEESAKQIIGGIKMRKSMLVAVVLTLCVALGAVAASAQTSISFANGGAGSVGSVTFISNGGVFPGKIGRAHV